MKTYQETLQFVKFKMEEGENPFSHLIYVVNEDNKDELFDLIEKNRLRTTKYLIQEG